MKRILIINVNWVGDVLFSTPFIKAIRKRFPTSYIACLVVPRCKPVLELNPSLDEIIVYDEDKRHRSILGKIRLIKLLRSKHFDVAFMLHRSFTRRIIALLSGIKTRIGYRIKKGGIFLTDAIMPPSKELHKVIYFLSLAGSPVTDASVKSCEFFVSDKDRTSIKTLLEKEGISKKDKLVVINPGGNWDPKRWPKENFSKLADLLINNSGVKIVISGAEKDIELANNIASSMKEKAVILAGKMSLKELGALLERADLVISNDSGPMHIAVSMETAVIALFGPTSSELTGPCGKGNYIVLRKNIGCNTPCYNYKCNDNRCMKAIIPEEVLQEAKKML